jgi:hypothetical protein
LTREDDPDRMQVSVYVGGKRLVLPYRLYVLIQVTEPADFFYNVTMQRTELYGRRP